MENIFTVYREELHKAVAAYPDEYLWTNTMPVNTVADRMIASMQRRTFNKDGRAFKATCKRLGIKHTYQAIHAAVAEAMKEQS